MKTYQSKYLAKEIKAHALKMVHESGSSHIGSCLSITDILAVLYNDILNIKSDNPNMPERDRFILSKGHACAALYATLALKRFFDVDKLSTFASFNSTLMSHASHKVPGVEFSTGSLGHGLPFGVGKALFAKMNNKKWNVFVLLSDGELNEGSNWESFMFASHHKLDNLNVIIDYNKLQSLTTTKKTLNLEPLKDKFESFGFFVTETDGHCHLSLKKSLAKRMKKNNQPRIIIAHTTKGKGIDFMENKVEWHYKSPNQNQLKEALNQVGNEL